MMLERLSGSLKSPLRLFGFVKQGVDELQRKIVETGQRDQI